MELLASGFGFLEAPRADAEGGLYFSDSSAVYRLDRHGALETVLDRACGGIALHAEGGIVVSGDDLSHLRQEQLRVLFAPPGIRGFNDVFTDARGRVLCGSLRPGVSGRPDDFTPGELWRVEAIDRAIRLYGDVGFSNGVGLSPDGRTIYQCDSSRRCVLVHEVFEDGTAVARPPISTERAPGLPDGLAVDEQGCIWVAMWEGGSIARFRPDGALDDLIRLPAYRVTSLCFTGHDLQDIIITTCDNTDSPQLKGCIYRMRTRVAGLPAPLARI